MQEIFVYFFSRFSEYYGQFNSHSASSCGSSNFINDDICSFETFFFHVWVLGKKFFSLSFFFLTIAARLPEIVPSKNVSYTTIIFVLWMECFWLPGATALSGFGWWQCCVCVCVCVRSCSYCLYMFSLRMNSVIFRKDEDTELNSRRSTRHVHLCPLRVSRLLFLGTWHGGHPS